MFLLLVIPEFAAAQQKPDAKADTALIKILDMPADTNKVNAYLGYVKTNGKIFKNETLFMRNTLQMVGIAKKKGFNKGLIALYDELFHFYFFSKNDFNKAFDYINYAYNLAKSTGHNRETTHALSHLAQCYLFIGDNAKALAAYSEAAAILKTEKSSYKFRSEAGLTGAIGRLYANNFKQYNKALPFDLKTTQLAINIKDTALIATGYAQAANDYYHLKQYPTAYLYCRKFLAFEGVERSTSYPNVNNTLGLIYRDASDAELTGMGVAPAARLQKVSEAFAEALKYAKIGAYLPNLVESLENTSSLYTRKGDYQKAYETYKEYILLRDSLENAGAKKNILRKQLNSEFTRQADSLKFQQQLTNTQLRAKQVQSYYFVGGLIVLAALSVFIWRNYDNQRKSNILLSEANRHIAEANVQLNQQRAEITTQRDRLTETVATLTSTQQQLIQTEKMASLGELTAGIAHEIQNPLNFVNNFSEVSIEMIAEANEEFEKGDLEEAKAIINDVQQNIEKIHFHGKRADSIVKNMLEHSRASAGKRELTDVNKLADEYLRLAYHGLRAKDKTFNAELETNLADDMPLVPLISQDVGRVLLNLFNNAFYAVQQKQRTAPDGYKPKVSLSTKQEDGQIMISVNDNGHGIPPAIRDKIMQPFFTTKPTGQGTGLGLSLSYDIIVKSHGGKIFLNPEVTDGTEMIVTLPLKKVS
ncbi:hypothetical protein BC343_04890 [Mucilaginibacter pedocola]|uniref:histidine kinase n=1 Tax=Mucilaginibacter pedocola TaxID=1792845 RepID=A0A1S9PEZ9_9SPHI|nr:hypothetical protein BC343_04890 [Mucilaginibacter pedocola]